MLYNQENNFRISEIYISCEYNEKHLESYKGIEVYLLSNKKLDLIEVIHTGNMNDDFSQVTEKYKGQTIFRSSSIDNYIMDSRIQPEML